MHDNDMPGAAPAPLVADDAIPHVHLGIVVPSDSAGPWHVIGWDEPAEAAPILYSALGAVRLGARHIPTADGSTIVMVVDLDAVRSDHNRNQRALAIGNHLGMRWDTVPGTVAYVGPARGPGVGINPRQYTWLVNALTEITAAYRAAHHMDRPHNNRPPI